MTATSPYIYIIEYYKTLEKDPSRDDLLKYYRNSSVLRINGKEFKSANDIVTQLIDDATKTSAHTFDLLHQKTLMLDECLVLVTGKMDPETEREKKFSAMFLIEDVHGENGCFINKQFVRY